MDGIAFLLLSGLFGFFFGYALRASRVMCRNVPFLPIYNERIEKDPALTRPNTEDEEDETCGVS